MNGRVFLAVRFIKAILREVMKMFMKVAHSSIKREMTQICSKMCIHSKLTSECESTIQYEEKDPRVLKAEFDWCGMSDECVQLKVADGRAREINESEFSWAERGGNEIYDVALLG